jgi:hypothetical protein
MQEWRPTATWEDATLTETEEKDGYTQWKVNQGTQYVPLLSSSNDDFSSLGGGGGGTPLAPTVNIYGAYADFGPTYGPLTRTALIPVVIQDTAEIDVISSTYMRCRFGNPGESHYVCLMGHVIIRWDGNYPSHLWTNSTLYVTRYKSSYVKNEEIPVVFGDQDHRWNYHKFSFNVSLYVEYDEFLRLEYYNGDNTYTARLASPSCWSIIPFYYS